MKLVTDGCLQAAKAALAAGDKVDEAIRAHAVRANNSRYHKVNQIAQYLVALFPQNATVMTQCFGETIVGMMLKEAKKAGRQVRLFWMDGGSRILRQESYAPGQLPKQLDGCGAAYLIAELVDSTGAVVRSLIQPDEDHPACLRSYAPGQWGTLAAIDTPVDWD